MRNSDLIFPTVALNKETEGLISDGMINSMKKTSIFVSIIHSEVYNHSLLLEKVKNNEIYGYGFEDKPGNFAKYEGNVFAMPELAWCTSESLSRNSENWLKNIELAVKGQFPTRVN